MFLDRLSLLEQLLEALGKMGALLVAVLFGIITWLISMLFLGNFEFMRAFSDTISALKLLIPASKDN